MPDVLYRDLAAFGLPFITASDPSFSELVDAIRESASNQWPPGEDLSHAAVLVNRGSQAVVTFGVIWAFVPRASLRFGPHFDPEMLAQPAAASRHYGILPGSKRLLTPRGIFGDNRDVLPPQPLPGGGMGFGGGAPLRNGSPVSLQLDVVLFEDGLCAGPDETRFFEAITRGIAEQMRISREIASLLGGGATAGAAFDLLRPMARHAPGPPLPYLQHFAWLAIERLIDGPDEGLPGWFEQHAQPPRLRLHRPQEPPP